MERKCLNEMHHFLTHEMVNRAQEAGLTSLQKLMHSKYYVFFHSALQPFREHRLTDGWRKLGAQAAWPSSAQAFPLKNFPSEKVSKPLGTRGKLGTY